MDDILPYITDACGNTLPASASPVKRYWTPRNRLPPYPQELVDLVCEQRESFWVSMCAKCDSQL
jgi:hypothetical protein